MRARLSFFVATLVSLPLLLALECQPIDRVDFISPLVPVTTPNFTIAFNLVGNFTGATPQAFLNNEALVVSGGPTDFTASQTGGAQVIPGPPLRDQNLLIVKARPSDGTTLIAPHTFDYAAPKARAFKMASLADCPVSGPLAHERVGDYCLENSIARFVVQDVTAPAVPTDPTPRDLYSVGAFGGNLIDAVLVSDPTTDNFLETTPMLNVETVVNAQTIVVVNDGQDGTPAIIRACGPDDLLDFVNPSSQLIAAGITPPGCTPTPEPICFDDHDQNVEACTSYTLAPLEKKVRLDTQVMNQEPVALNMIVGDWMNASGEVDGWFKPNPGMGEAVTQNTTGGLTWYAEPKVPGTRFEYGYVPVGTVPTPPNGPGSYVTVSGVTVILHDINAAAALLGFPSNFVVPSGGSKTDTRYITVDNGMGNSAQELAEQLAGQTPSTVQGCVTVRGASAPNAFVTIGTRNAALTGINQALAHFVTDAAGCYSGKVETAPVTSPPTLYGAIAGKEGVLYVGGAATPPMTSFSPNPAGSVRTINFALPATGTLQVTVADASGNPVPSRVSVVGFDPSPEPTVAGSSLPGFGSSTLGRLNDIGDDEPFGIVAFDYTGASGVASFHVEPGTYHVYVSRGTEYSLWTTVPPQGSGGVTITGGAVTALNAKIERVLDTQDFISSDFHVHGIASADSEVADRTRAVEFAGEGVENLIATDHHVHKTYLPVMQALGLAAWVTSTVGEEITTFDYGHFNGYPFKIDPSVPSGGSTDWAVAAPPGKDFPQYGAYNLGPADIFHLATTEPEAKPYTTVQINHIDSHFAPLKINTALVPPQDSLTATDRKNLRLDPANPPPGQIFYAFPALELWNGSSRAHPVEFTGSRIGIWMNLLDQGIETTAIADTDTHEYRQMRTAGARTWTATSPGNDTPLLYQESELASSVVEGRAVGGQGIYVQTRLLAGDGSGAVADLTKGGQHPRRDEQRRGDARDPRAVAALGRVGPHRDLQQHGRSRELGGGRSDQAVPLLRDAAADAGRRRLQPRHHRRRRLRHRRRERRAERAGRRAARGGRDAYLHRRRRGRLVRRGGEGHGRRLRPDVPGVPAEPRDGGQNHARESRGRQRGPERNHGARLHERPLRRALRRRFAAAACVAALWSAAGASPVAAEGEPAAGGVHLFAALERGPGAAVLVFEEPRRVDGETWVADATIERSFYGGEAGSRVAVAWEELAHQRPVRFAAGDRVLCALESLPGQSIWRQRFPDPKLRASTLAIAEKGDAFLRAPSLGALLLLQHYLALPAEMRQRNAGVGYLVDIAAEAEPSFAAAGVERLAAVPNLDAQIDPSSAARLVAALLRPDAPDDLVAGLLALIRSGPLRALRPTLDAYASRDALAPSRVYEALGRIDDGLPAALAERLLAVRDSEPLRAAGARFATGSALERLPRVLRSDPAASVRGIAAQRWLAMKGIAGAPELRPALLDADRDVRLAALLALAQRGPEAVPTLRDALPAASPELTREIVAALALAGGPEAAQALVELAEKHPDAGVRLLAKSALGREIGHKD